MGISKSVILVNFLIVPKQIETLENYTVSRSVNGDVN